RRPHRPPERERLCHHRPERCTHGPRFQNPFQRGHLRASFSSSFFVILLRIPMVMAVRILTPTVPHRLPAQRANLRVVGSAAYVSHSVSPLVVISDAPIIIVDSRLSLVHQGKPAFTAVVELTRCGLALKPELQQPIEPSCLWHIVFISSAQQI